MNPAPYGALADIPGITKAEESAVLTALENRITILRESVQYWAARSARNATGADTAVREATRLAHAEHAYRKLCTNSNGCFGIDRYLPAVYRDPAHASHTWAPVQAAGPFAVSDCNPLRSGRPPGNPPAPSGSPATISSSTPSTVAERQTV